MNEKNPRDEHSIEQLIKAGFDEANRPTPAAREAAWNRVKAAWQSEYASTAAAQDAAAEPPAQRQSESHNETNNGESLMKLILRHRLGFGLGTLTCAAAIVITLILASPGAHATASQVMVRGAQAASQLTGIHLKGKLRTLPADNFGSISLAADFQNVELWKQWEPELKWRVEKPGRVALMDGADTVLYVKSANIGVKVPGKAQSAFDTDWLQTVANISKTLSNEVSRAQSHGWTLDLSEERAPDGSLKDIVTVHTKVGVPDDDYGKNTFIDTSDTRRVYRFDDKTERLEGVQIYVSTTNGEVQVFELTQIDYNQPTAPSTWQLDLPPNVAWSHEPQILPDNDRYASMTPEEATRAFFEACGSENWAEAEKFLSPMSDKIKQYMAGLQIISLGTAFTSQSYPGRFVPYEILLRPQTFYIRVANTNSAKRYVLTSTYDSNQKLQEDLQWSGEPEILPNNDAYARLSPVEVVQAYLDAHSKCDWVELRKFTSKFDADGTQRKAEQAKKAGMDVQKMMPVIKVIEAIPGPDQSSYLVKCNIISINKHNLAVRKDNPAGRWQVDGGF